MRRTTLGRWAVIGAVVAASSLLMLMSSGASAGTTRAARPVTLHHPLVPLAPRRGAAQHAGTTSSQNWSGYADLAPAGHHVTSVTGHWIVPSVQLVPPGFSGGWTGIGGVNSSDLIQAGTAMDTLPVLGPQYYAWYEILPDGETQLSGCSGDPNCTVNPGDWIVVNITALGNSMWRIFMGDTGHWTWATTLSYHSSQSSAEWVLEAPSIIVGPTLLTNVGAMTFDNGNGFALDGVSKLIGQGSPMAIRLDALGLLTSSVPSTLDSEGDGFRACTYGATCAPPSS